VYGNDKCDRAGDFKRTHDDLIFKVKERLAEEKSPRQKKLLLILLDRLIDARPPLEKLEFLEEKVEFKIQINYSTENEDGYSDYHTIDTYAREGLCPCCEEVLQASNQNYQYGTTHQCEKAEAVYGKDPQHG
jgi:hypothetical protein